MLTITAGLATDFIGAARGVNQVWVTDITEHPTREGKLYFCAAKATLSNRIVGYSAAPPMSSRLAVTTPNTAVAPRQINRRSVTGCIVHSDRGSRFRSRRYRRLLVRPGLKGSLGRATAGDDAAMESLFSLLQRQVS
ncbi:DDE-type integrase/transposase/recombinase [Corynebacterium meridianum]|uniref:DDE-type integrase/transposase/recombinase n=1 Tax=Corynebacterium meridianum TaxID=2765363 RepID=A0A934I0X1_9CORY|nr:DDE-type integrase/transposase/recombinase [Corynebacterium meridianum]